MYEFVSYHSDCRGACAGSDSGVGWVLRGVLPVLSVEAIEA